MHHKQKIIILDTETTGLDAQTDRIIEIGAIEMINRQVTKNIYHVYIQPDKHIEDDVIKVHGITNEFLEDKPRFNEVAQDFIEFIKGNIVVAHNAPFDTGFINAELARLGPKYGELEDYCEIIDTLAVAKDKFPGKRNNLDALCNRLNIDNSTRNLHGALIDSEILADVYLALTAGQTSLLLDEMIDEQTRAANQIHHITRDRSPKIILATNDELARHSSLIKKLTTTSGDKSSAWEM